MSFNAQQLRQKMLKRWRKDQQRCQTPNYYGHSRNQFSTPRSYWWRIIITIPSGTKIVRRCSSHKKRRGKRIFHSNRSRKYEKKCQRWWRTPNYYGRYRSQLLTSRRKKWRIRTAISSITETARQSSAYKKIRGKLISHSNRSRKYEKKHQPAPN